MNWTGQDWTGTTAPDKTGPDWTRPDRTRPDQIGSYQSRPDRTRPDIAFLAQKRATLGNWCQKPAFRAGIYRKTEGIQSYLGIWGRYDPIEPGLSEAKKVGYMGIA